MCPSGGTGLVVVEGTHLLARGESGGDLLALVVVGGGGELGLKLGLERLLRLHHQLCDQEKTRGVQRKMRPTRRQSARKVVGGGQDGCIPERASDHEENSAGAMVTMALEKSRTEKTGAEASR